MSWFLEKGENLKRRNLNVKTKQNKNNDVIKSQTSISCFMPFAIHRFNFTNFLTNSTKKFFQLNFIKCLFYGLNKFITCSVLFLVRHECRLDKHLYLFVNLLKQIKTSIKCLFVYIKVIITYHLL